MEGQNSSGGAKQAVGGAGCAAILLVLAVISFVLGGGGQTDTPAPTPTIMDNDAAIVHEVGVIVQPIVEAAAEAQRADTQTVHATATPEPTPVPSMSVQVGRVWGWPLAFVVVGCGSMGTLGLVALAWIWAKRPVAAPEQPKEEEDIPTPSGVIVHNGTAPDDEE